MRRPYNGTYALTRVFGIKDPAYSRYPDSRHPGADYGLPPDTPLVAPIRGRASIIDANPAVKVGRGKEVIITNGNVQVKLCHMNKISVRSGDVVTEGQLVGLSGFTGYVIDAAGRVGTKGGAHLHFEVLISGVYVDPEIEFKKPGGEVMIQDTDNEYGRWRSLGWFVRGRELSRDEFRAAAVGLSWLRAVEILMDDPEAQAAQDAQNLGQLAARDDWRGQIYRLQEGITKEQSKVGALTQRIKELEAGPAKATEDTAFLNALAEAIQKLNSRTIPKPASK